VERPVASGYNTNVRSPPDRRGAARDTRGRLKRELTEDQIADLVARRAQDQSYREIEKATGVPKSTASALCRQPDVQAMIASLQAGIAAAEKEQANAVKRERQREARRKSAAAQRERKRHATSPSGPIRRHKEDSEDDLDAIERRIAPEWTPLCGVQILDGEGRIVFSRAYDRLDESVLGELADELRAAGVRNPRTAIVEDLANCRPGQRVVYKVEPEPERTPAEEAAHGVFEPLLQPVEAPGHSDIRTELEAEGVIPPLFSEADLAPSERPD
jgi:DNA invertase Pin-like site-specific DNA recombinase